MVGLETLGKGNRLYGYEWNARIKQQPEWYGFEGVSMLDPLDPLFDKMGKIFLIGNDLFMESVCQNPMYYALAFEMPCHEGAMDGYICYHSLWKVLSINKRRMGNCREILQVKKISSYLHCEGCEGEMSIYFTE